MKKIMMLFVTCLMVFSLLACDRSDTPDPDPDPDPDPNGGENGDLNGTTPIGWDGKSIFYTASDIRNFGSGTPRGMVNFDAENNLAYIWNTDAGLDNYGGVQTPVLSLDFSKAVIFEMEVISVYTQYIVKLAVEGELDYYYVLSDDDDTGTISINVVDAMLSDKYRIRNTQPDPGYSTGWKYHNQVKNCTFHILAKGPDGESQTAELVVSHIAIYNDKAPITDVTISSDAIQNNMISRLKNATPIQLNSTILPIEDDNQGVIWRSADEGIASVDENGLVSFTGVGETTITAISRVDQSKRQSITVNTLSGYENPTNLKQKLTTLTYGGSNTDVGLFEDLFRTTWGENIKQSLSLQSRSALSVRNISKGLIVENYFNPNNSNHVTEANLQESMNQAYARMTLTGNGGATLYRNIDGQLFEERYTDHAKLAYALFNSSWSKKSTITEETIVVWDSGDVMKYTVELLAVTLLGNYSAQDFTNSNFWIIPDRTRQTEDGVIHALSPASVSIDSNIARIRQNKYPEAKFHFGGLVSRMYQASSTTEVEIIIDVPHLTRASDAVITMWEIKIIYYDANGNAINTNPLKIDAGNTEGIHTISFTPAYDQFRIYFVVNGSDIGAQFSGAEMHVQSFKVYKFD